MKTTYKITISLAIFLALILVSTPTIADDTCYNFLESMPINCTGGSITSDIYDGGRHITCSANNNSLSIAAWEKPNTGTKQYFEIYKKNSTGNGIQICLAGTCIQSNEGYSKSQTYPICTTNQGNPNSAPQAPVSSVKDMPLTCTNGVIQSDTFNGARRITCSLNTNSLSIEAWNKPSDTNPQFFEMYKKNSTGTAPTICLGNTCISNNGYAKSPLFSIINVTPPANNTPPTNNTLPTNTTCFNSIQSMPINCTGGSITSDIYDGGRHITCSANNNSLSIAAWEKPNTGTKQYFEIYKKNSTGNGIQICLAGTCIQSNEGYSKSQTYPICTTNPSSPNSAPQAPVWLEPVPGATNIDTVDFHIQVFEIQDTEGDKHIASDFEVWNVATNQRVWAIDHTTNLALLRHVHNGDGVFQANLTGQLSLAYNTQYRVRARFYVNSTINNVSPWSEWVIFTTKAKPSDTGGNILWTARSGYEVQTVATGINTPVNLAAAPNIYTNLSFSAQPLLYVTQLYGKIGLLRKDGSYTTYADNLLNYNTVGSLPGSGETGVDGIYVDPITGDLFISLVYANASSPTGFYGKIDRFYTNDNGDGYTSVKTILSGIEVAPSHHIHQITRGPDEKLYVGVGDAHDTTAAQNTSRTAGKILRFNNNGSIPADNPIPGSYYYAGGFRNPFGSAWRPGTNELFVTNNGPNNDDSIYKVSEGSMFGWCCDTATGAWYVWSETTAPTQVAFGAGIFPNSSMYVVLSGPTYSLGPDPISKRIVEFTFNENGSEKSVQDLVTYTGQGHGAPIGLAFTNDSLYFTDIYGEQGLIGAAQTKGNIYRVVIGNRTGPTASEEIFSASISPKDWYPQGLKVVWVCKAIEGSGNYTYSFNFGDGQQTGMQMSDNVYHSYTSPGTYAVSCTAQDTTTSLSTTGSTTITLNLCQVEDFQCN